MSNRFDAWLQFAEPGSEYIYHRGGSLSKKGEGLNFSSQVYSAREAYDRGEVELVMRRVTWGQGKFNNGSIFEWIAQKRKIIVKREPWIAEGQIVRWVERPEKRALKKAA